MKNKILENELTWTPLDQRKSRFGGPTSPRKPENRVPIYWLARQGNELYFVNASEEALDSLIASSGGFETTDVGVLTVASSKNYEYKNITPNMAVKVDEYDGFYDLDCVLQVTITIQSTKFGTLHIIPPAKKGGVNETVLLWNTNETGKHVVIKRMTE